MRSLITVVLLALVVPRVAFGQKPASKPTENASRATAAANAKTVAATDGGQITAARPGRILRGPGFKNSAATR